MKTLDVRKLVEGKKVEILIPEKILEIYSIWKLKRGGEPEPLEIFYAGYILSNPMIREQYLKLKEKEIKTS